MNFVYCHSEEPFGCAQDKLRDEESRCWDKPSFHDEKRDPSFHFVSLRMTLMWVII
jgi:hypothetical protein